VKGLHFYLITRIKDFDKAILNFNDVFFNKNKIIFNVKTITYTNSLIIGQLISWSPKSFHLTKHSESIDSKSRIKSFLDAHRLLMNKSFILKMLILKVSFEVLFSKL
jgi:hypothetical protein